MIQADSLGRSTFHHITPQERVHPTNREIRWLKHIERHGPQSSQYLYELTRDTHRCKDTALRQLQKLRAGGYLTLPRQQRATERAEFNQYIYDLTKKAQDHLVDHGIAEPTVRPTGHWWHGYMTSCVTSSIDIAAARCGVRYISAHEVLAIKGTSMAIPIGRSKLIPDQLFALDYGGSFRAFSLEIDRGTEPKTSRLSRKSYASSIEMYRKVIEQKLYQSHYGLKASLLALWVFSSRTNEIKFLEMVANVSASLSAAILTQSLPSFNQDMHSAPPLSKLFYGAWNRAKGEEIVIGSAP
ncbi:MAG: hypothetical protein COC12_05085 [Rhodobacteraceae bacterium]|nr:MAG: hypothetical protein COC12_05085 [Paracoccaceae bacterium]